MFIVINKLSVFETLFSGISRKLTNREALFDSGFGI